MEQNTSRPLDVFGPAAEEARQLFADLRAVLADIAANGVHVTTKIETPFGSLLVTTDVHL